MLIVIAVGITLAAVAIPVLSSAMTNMRINSAVSQFTGALASARYQAIQNSQIYTFALTTPANTYVVTKTGANPVVYNAVQLSPYVTISGSGSASSPFTYTLCPNGIVYGAGGACPGNQPASLIFTYNGRQIDLAVSGVGNVTSTIIH